MRAALSASNRFFTGVAVPLCGAAISFWITTTARFHVPGNQMLLRLGLTLLLGLSVACAGGPAPKAKFAGVQPMDPALLPALAEVPDVPGLPRVLLLGDSISIAYTLAVRARLAGRANVHRPGENTGATEYALDRLEAWLGSGRWAVIHFNFGLHDLKYLDAEGNYVTPDRGRQVAPPPEYEKNLRELVRRLQRTGARLVFATTTPIPAGTQGRVEGGELPYNDAARRVMREAGVALNDLHAFVRPRQAELQLPRNVHFSPAGSDALAARVADSIATELKVFSP